jgi:threonine dehydratase
LPPTSSTSCRASKGTLTELLDIYAARKRLAKYLPATPLVPSHSLSAIVQKTVWLKLESIQLTNSFKIRGAFNALLRLLEENPALERRAPIVTASAGNHGRGLAYAAEQLGVKVIVFTPRTAPETKKAAIRRHGAILRDDPVDYDHAENAARAYANEHGGIYVSPYNNADVIAGAGTIGLEIVESLPTLDELIVPLGGGGLASGVGLVIKALAPKVIITGVEVAASRPFATGIREGRITAIDPQPSLADGLTGNLEPGTMTFDLVRTVVDRLVSVDEDAVAGAVRLLARDEHLITEGAGATATAALLAGESARSGQHVVVLVTGANIDFDKFLRIAH